jgi:hypothetical protein
MNQTHQTKLLLILDSSVGSKLFCLELRVHPLLLHYYYTRKLEYVGESCKGVWNKANRRMSLSPVF